MTKTTDPAEQAALSLLEQGKRGEGVRKLQIIPADGWLASYEDEGSGEVSRLPLSCWALVDTTYFVYPPGGPSERVGFQSVEGVLAADGGFAKDRPGFVGYTRNAEAATTEEA